MEFGIGDGAVAGGVDDVMDGIVEDCFGGVRRREKNGRLTRRKRNSVQFARQRKISVETPDATKVGRALWANTQR